MNDFSLSNLDVLNQVQLIVPLDYTMWNFRQKIVLQNKSAQVLATELKFVAKALLMNPKVYTVWEYRKFLITQ